MRLPGRLSASTLGDLLGALHRQRTSGSLELVETASGKRHRIHLVAGLVVEVETSAPVPRIGELLRRAGYFEATAIARMLRRLADGDTRQAGEILMSEGLIDAEALGAALRVQVRAKLDELFRLEDAAIRFHAARRTGARDAGPLTADDFLHGRPRARDRREPARARVHEPARNEPNGAPRPALDPGRARALRMLGLGDDAGTAEVRRAFRRLAAELHPDRLAQTARDALRAPGTSFAELSAAYHLLVA
jgi:hypothetical protein